MLDFLKNFKNHLTYSYKYVIIYTESEVRLVNDNKIKELFKLLNTIEKLIIQLISVIGWIKILIDIIC